MNKDYTFINTGKAINLRSLIVSGDIDDKAIINIYDAQGKFIVRGEWYRDGVLAYSEDFGTARKVGTGHSISFKLIGPERS